MTNHKCLIIILFTLMKGCSIFEADQSPYPETGIADDGLLINIREHHNDYEGSDPELVLEMSTIKYLECANYFIDYQKRIKDTSIDIRLLGIDIGPFCLTAFGPAGALVSISDVVGKKELVIQDGDLRDRYEIHVTDIKVDITPIDATFTETRYTRYYRKPENSFHFYCHTQGTMTHLCQDFHDLLLSELDIVEFEFPDDGYNPYVRGQSDTRGSRFYTYNTVSEFHTAGELLESFTHEKIGDTQGNSLSIYNWRHKGYRSWSF